jgi:hypothetical protein
MRVITTVISLALVITFLPAASVHALTKCIGPKGDPLYTDRQDCPQGYRLESSEPSTPRGNASEPPLKSNSPALSSPSANRSYSIAGRGSLVLPVPGDWKDEVKIDAKGSLMTIAYLPPSGTGFAAHVSVLLDPNSAEVVTKEWARETADLSAESLRPQAREERIDLRELGGGSADGYYFVITDKKEIYGPGEFKYLTQGVAAVGDLGVLFGILTNDPRAAVVDAFLAAVRGARQSK